MDWAKRLVTSSIGSKALMALSGAALLGFVFMHMAGNLLVFAGPDALNTYAHNIKGMGALLWVARLGLLGAVVAHVAVAFKLYMANREARPMRYQYQDNSQTTITGRTMIVSGSMLAAFIIYHLLHYTLGVVGAETFAGNNLTTIPNVAEQVPDAYKMVTAGFSQPVVVGVYVVAMLLLGSHLSHGVASLFQSLGLNNTRFRPLVKQAGFAVAGLLTVGNISMPVAVLAGLI